MSCCIFGGTGCDPQVHGNFRLISTDVLPNRYEKIFDSRTTGTQCYESIENKQVELAVRNAISKQPGADALIMVDIWLYRESDQACVKAEGLPVKMK